MESGFASIADNSLLPNGSILFAFFLICGIIIFLLVTVYKQQRLIRLLRHQNEEYLAVQEELAAQEEELRQNFKELYVSEEIIRHNDEINRLISEGSNDGLWVWDITTDIKTVSERGWNMLGLPEKSVATKERWKKEIVHPEDLPHMITELERHFSGQSPFYQVEYRAKSANGSYRWILSRGKASFDSSGQPLQMAGSYTDITDSKFKEDRIRHMAYYDTLTGLANRERLIEVVRQALAENEQGGRRGALLFIDIDNFKLINDTYGHSWGDKLLVSLSGRLSSLMQEGGVTARLGGDEIVIFLPDMHNLQEVTDFADKTMRMLEQPTTVNGHVFHITASAGIAMYPEHGADVEELLRKADMAMYSAKTSGKHTYRFFDKSMQDEVVEKTLLEARLRHAIQNNEFRLHYQPEYNMLTGQIDGFETLLRWESPDYGLVPPLKFIPLAEETGLIITIGNWALKTACAFNQALFAAGQRRLKLSVNISVVQLMQANFVQVVADILTETGLPPEQLELELTESVLMEKFEDNIRKLRELRDMGVQIALDDFGTGYSSLTYLRKLPITALKIDKAFIDDIAVGDSTIIGSIIEMAHQLGLVVVAEGVEIKEQFAYLKQQGCDIIQGYLISRPLPPEEFTVMVQG